MIMNHLIFKFRRTFAIAILIISVLCAVYSIGVLILYTYGFSRSNGWI